MEVAIIITAIALAQAAPATTWNAEASPGTCAATYKLEGDTTLSDVAITRTLGAPVTFFTVGVFTGSYPDDPPRYTSSPKGALVLADGTTFALTGRQTYVGRRYRVDLNVKMSSADLDHLRHAERLSLKVDDAALSIANLPGPAGLIDGIADCEKGALAALGLDPAKHAEAPPVEAMREWITYLDYPVEALRSEATGRVVALIKIAADGTPSSVTLISAPTFDVLDQATVTLLSTRARFAPGADDRWFIQPVVWTLPD